MYESNYITPIYNDDVECPNENCHDGYIYEAVYNDDTNQLEMEKNKCEYCLNH